MPTVAPYRPVSPAGSPQPPFESVPRGQLLSMRPPTTGDAATSFVDRTSPDPRRARWGGADEAVRSLQREHQTPQQQRGPGAPPPPFDIPQAPAEVSFGDWLERNHPEMAGRTVNVRVANHLSQQYSSWLSGRREMDRTNIARSRAQMQAAQYTANRRGPVPTTREGMDTMLEREAYGEGGLPAMQKRRREVRPPARKTGDIIKRRFMELVESGNVAGARKLVDTWQGRGVLDDMTVVKALAPAVRRIQEAVSMMGQEPSEDEREMITLHRDAIRRLAAQRQPTGPGAADANIPSAWSQLIGPRTPDPALPTGASSPFGAAGQPTAGQMGAPQPTMDDDTGRRLTEAFQRGEITREELNKFFQITGIKP